MRSRLPSALAQPTSLTRRSGPIQGVLFAYGTLRSASNHAINKILERYGEVVASGRISGILYDIGRYPGTVKTTRTRAFVRGDVYLLRDADVR